MKKAFLLFLLLAISHSALAMRCNSKLALEGDSSAKFRKICGEPEHIERSVIFRSIGLQSKTHINLHQQVKVKLKEEEAIQIEKWTYNFGPRKLIRVVTFENGIATNIDVGGRGY